MASQNQTNQKTTPTPIKDHSYITKLPTFADRGAAIAKRLEEVKANPKYQALPEEHKTKVRADIYHKYVPASYSGFHLPVPDEKTWVEATAGENYHFNNEKLSSTYEKTNKEGGRSDFWRRNEETRHDASAGANKAVTEVKLFGARVANRAFMGMFDLAQHFTHETNLSDLIVPGSTEAKRREEFLKTDTMRMVKNYEDTQRSKIQGADFWIQTHPRDTVIGRLDGMVGEQVATLPLYEAVGVLGAATKVGAVVGSKIPLTAKLSASPSGKWVAKRLVEATDGYLATLVTSGGSNKEAEKGAASFAVGGAVLGSAGKLLKIAAAPLIKKWTANTIAMGGKVLAQELAHSGMTEAEIEASHEGDGIAHIKRVEEIRSFMADTTKSAAARAERETELGKLGAQQEERTNKIKAWKERQEQRARLDPILHKLHEGEKVSLNSIAVAQFKKNLNQLSKNQRALVLAKRMDLIDQAAIEAPVHLPELHHDEVAQQIEQSRKELSAFNTLTQTLEKLGIKIETAPIENDITQIKEQTGIKNGPAGAKKVAKVNKEASKATGEVITPERFVSLSNESVSYLRAPRNRTAFNETVSDRSKAGANKFIDELKKASPGNIHFEDPAHLMLFHYANKGKLDKSLVAALTYRLRQTAGRESYTAAQLAEEAVATKVHMYSMARSGHLQTEGNIFRSSQLHGPWRWTKWQRQLESDGDKAIMQKTISALKQHPQAQKAYKATLNILKKDRPNIKTAEQYYDYVRKMDNYSRNIELSFR